MNISTDEKMKLKEEMDKKNKYLSSLYSSFSSLKKTVSFSFYDELNDDDKKRLIFYLMNKYTENIPVLQIEKESKNIFSFLKRKENNILPIKNNFYICKTDTFFFITDKIDKKYHYHINKPVIIHSRDAIQDTYNLLKKYKLNGRIHCFSGSVEMARLFTSLGYKIGIGGIITYKNAKTIKEVVRDTDLAYILLETDSPYLAPEPYRGKSNRPSYIPIIVDEIA